MSPPSAGRRSSSTSTWTPISLAAPTHVPSPKIQQALGNANLNTGGQRLTAGEQSFTVRGVGSICSTRDVGDVVVTTAKGAPVRVRDVAAVTVGAAPLLGQVGLNGEGDVVQGVVLMRYGGRTRPTLEGIHARLEEIKRRKLLPPGMEIPAHLRPRRARRPHHPHRDGERARGADWARGARAGLLPGELEGGAGTIVGEHPARPCGLRRHGPHRNAGQPHLARRRGLRHRGRVDRHHGGERLSPPGRERHRRHAAAHPGRGRGGCGCPLASPPSSWRWPSFCSSP